MRGANGGSNGRQGREAEAQPNDPQGLGLTNAFFQGYTFG
jgi:hypothetical protein